MKGIDRAQGGEHGPLGLGDRFHEEYERARVLGTNRKEEESVERTLAEPRGQTIVSLEVSLG